MSKKVWYGNLTNRLEEGRNFTGREIAVGDDITEYLWSDRHCYYVVAVENQKRIKVRPYYTCADHEKEGGMGHQDWLYFKTVDEINKYSARFNDYWKNAEHFEEPAPQTWVYRYNKWVREVIYKDLDEKHLAHYTKREQEQYKKHGYIKSYFDLSGRVSFGVRDYYYDWEF